MAPGKDRDVLIGPIIALEKSPENHLSVRGFAGSSGGDIADADGGNIAGFDLADPMVIAEVPELQGEIVWKKNDSIKHRGTKIQKTAIFLFNSFVIFPRRPFFAYIFWLGAHLTRFFRGNYAILVACHSQIVPAKRQIILKCRPSATTGAYLMTINRLMSFVINHGASVILVLWI